RLLVDKLVYLVRSPRRWEVVVFRLFGFTFIKRIIGLPGETVEIRDGDIWINGALVRKTLGECRQMRIPVFDSSHTPADATGYGAWELQPAEGSGGLTSQELHLDGTQPGRPLQAATWRPYFSAKRQSAPICDEYGYNGNQCLPLREVHDF